MIHTDRDPSVPESSLAGIVRLALRVTCRHDVASLVLLAWRRRAGLTGSDASANPRASAHLPTIVTTAAARAGLSAIVRLQGGLSIWSRATGGPGRRPHAKSRAGRMMQGAEG